MFVVAVVFDADATVTGAAGGVGSVAVAILGKLGYGVAPVEAPRVAAGTEQGGQGGGRRGWPGWEAKQLVGLMCGRGGHALAADSPQCRRAGDYRG